MKLRASKSAAGQHSPQEAFERAFEELSREYAELTARLAAIKASPTLPSMEDLEEFAAKVADKLKLIGTEVELGIDRVADRYSELSAPLRQFMLDHGLTRSAITPNPLKTILILQACMAVEAAGSGSLLVGDGVMSWGAGLLTGAVFSGVNIALGVTAGYAFFRLIGYRKAAIKPKRKDRIVRWLASAASGVAVALMGTMHFAAARVRVTGSHSNIWDWEAPSFAATFSDFYAIALLLLGSISSLIAIREGYAGFSDPVAGYSEVTKETEERINAALDRAYADGVERLENTFDRAAERLEAAAAVYDDARDDYLEELQALRPDIGRFNAQVKLAALRLKAAQAQENKHRQYVAGAGRDYDAISLDLSAIRSLAIDASAIPIAGTALSDPGSHLARVEDAFEEAEAALRAAHTSASQLTTLPFFEARSTKQEKRT